MLTSVANDHRAQNHELCNLSNWCSIVKYSSQTTRKNYWASTCASKTGHKKNIPPVYLIYLNVIAIKGCSKINNFCHES